MFQFSNRVDFRNFRDLEATLPKGEYRITIYPGAPCMWLLLRLDGPGGTPNKAIVHIAEGGVLSSRFTVL
jgi:hypothetical protein